MGNFDGPEVCKLVGLYILNSISRHCHVSNVGLYRDDGLEVLKTHLGKLADKARKDCIKTFSEFGLKITNGTNLHVVNFPDVRLNVKDSTYVF